MMSIPGFELVLRHRELLRQLTVRDFQQRYRGSYLGALWSFIVPLASLMTYSFIFSFVFKAHWRPEQESTSLGEFSLILFAGLIPFNLFAESAARSPTSI